MLLGIKFAFFAYLFPELLVGHVLVATHAGAGQQQRIEFLFVEGPAHRPVGADSCHLGGVPAVFLPLAEHLNSDIASVLSLSFWMYLLFGCAALLWGMAADYWGTGILMVVHFVVAGISGIEAAVWLYDPAKFTVCIGASGFSQAFIIPQIWG